MTDKRPNQSPPQSAPAITQAKPQAATPPPPAAQASQPQAQPQAAEKKQADVVLPEQVAAFAARESEWLKKELAYQAKLAELEKAKQAAAEYEKLVAELKSDPYSVAERHGASLENWAKRTVQGDPKKPTVEEIVPKLLDEIKSLREKYEQQEQAVQMTAARSDAAMYASEMLQHMQGMEAEKWAPVKQYMRTLSVIGGREPDLVSAVQQMIITARQTNGKLLTPAEACETLLKEASDYMNKLASVITPQNGGTAQPQAAPAVTAQPPQATLTTAAETQAAPAVDLSSMTPEQRREEVIRRLISGAYQIAK